MIETTRYLTNQFIWENPRGLPQIEALKDSLLSSHLVLNNNKGPLYRLLLKQMHQILKSGYFEFNAKVYQRFTVHALNNLYSFSSNSAVVRAAASVLDYTSTKFIFQNYRSIRLGPYRRNAEKYLDDKMFLDDAACSFFGIQSGDFPYNEREIEKFWKESASHASSALFSAVLDYRIPDVLMDLWLDTNTNFWSRMRTRHKFNRKSESTPECYFKTPRFLVTCGGRYKFYRGANFPIRFQFNLKDKPWVYDIMSRSSSIIWEPGGSYSHRIQGSVLKFKGDQWKSNNLSTYKNFIYGYGKKNSTLTKGKNGSFELPFELPLLFNGKSFVSFENNNFVFRTYSVPEKGIYVILTILKNKNTWWKYNYQKYTRGTLEILDTAWTGPFESVAKRMYTQNHEDSRKHIYTMHNGEKLWLNPKYSGKKPGILKIDSPLHTSPNSKGELEYQKVGLYGINLEEDELPLIVVHKITPLTLTPDQIVVYADGEGLLVVKNHQLKKELNIDFTAWWHPGRKITSLGLGRK